MAEVRLVNVTKAFGKTVVVEDFSLDIADGEYVILVGPSGCGKSTILRSIAGIEEITTGEIWIGDRQVQNLHPRDRDVAMVFQNYALYPHMNVYENMAFCLRQRKTDRREIDRIVRGAARMLGIDELPDRKPGQLSGGQRQRVVVGRTIVRNPKVFLFDEPLSNLDAKLRTAMRAELLGLHQTLGTTTVYVTHDQMEAMTMGDRIVVMNKGAIQQMDTPQNVYEHPVNKYVAGFIGSPPMNFIDCRLVEGEGSIRAVNRELDLRIPPSKLHLVAPHCGKAVVLGIRPEHITYPLSNPSETNGSTFQAAVWMVELLGSEKLVHLKIESDVMTARLDPHITLKAGDASVFEVKMERVHIFDKETELTVV
jgi:multiple sugar transport system ATP-binding protein